MSASERGGKEKREMAMEASDETDLSHHRTVAFYFTLRSFALVVENAWLWDLDPCHVCTQTSQNWSFEVEKGEKSMEESSADILVYRSLNSSKYF